MRYYHIGLAVPVNYLKYEVGASSDEWWFESLSKLSNTPLTETIFFHNKMKAEIDKINDLISRSKTTNETRDLIKRRDELVAIRERVRQEIERKQGPKQLGVGAGIAIAAFAILIVAPPLIIAALA